MPTPAPVVRAAPPPPRAPRRSLEQVIGGRWTTWIGAIAVLIAVGLLLRWTFENDIIGPVGRVVIGIVSGIGLLAGGIVVRRRPALAILADGLTGAGLGILYLSLYAAHRVYGFLGAGATLGFMALVTAAGVAISVAWSRQAVAILAVLGGLLTPVLVSTARPDERSLLAYLLVLDLIVLGVARYRTWPGLNRLAWLGSAILFLPFLVKSPAADHPSWRLALLSLLFLLFLIAPVLRSWLEKKPAGPLDLLLVTGNGAAYFFAVYVTLEHWRESFEGPWALALAGLYFAVAQVHAERVPGDRATGALHRGAAAVLLALAAPLLADGPWVTLAWAVQAAVFVYVATLVPRAGVALGGAVVLYALAAVRAASVDPYWYETTRPLWNLNAGVHLAVVAALAWGGWVAMRARAPGLAGEEGLSGTTAAEPALGSGAADLRTALWFAAACLLAVLAWREPAGLWRSALLSVELLALGALARTLRDRAFAFGAAAVALALIARAFVADHRDAADAAARLVNAHLAVRVGACGAIALAGAWVAGSGVAAARFIGAGLRALAGFALLVALSLAWVFHHEMQARDALAAGQDDLARRLRWITQVGLSVLWTLYAAAALALGFVGRLAAVRYAALGLLGVTIVKVFLVDLSELEAIYRVLSFLVLGIVLLVVAWAYQRRGASGEDENAP